MSDSVHQATSRGIETEEASAPLTNGVGTKDGVGSGDHDMPFAGHRAYPFSTHVRLKLLLLRGEVLDARLGRGRFADDVS